MVLRRLLLNLLQAKSRRQRMDGTLERFSSFQLAATTYEKLPPGQSTTQSYMTDLPPRREGPLKGSRNDDGDFAPSDLTEITTLLH